ncbi:hypothetical protein Hypma_007029 [Hypsizygus marmoreus]|uniref:Uncharacterized protein n=1 Tax=Hypsizygus marmoreus TaxID=39966 RepID=A0A369KHK7_HYPMA|nr:hypothetical protein Hypma_007029 [Hypsizygus marmoreus]
MVVLESIGLFMRIHHQASALPSLFASESELVVEANVRLIESSVCRMTPLNTRKNDKDVLLFVPWLETRH